MKPIAISEEFKNNVVEEFKKFINKGNPVVDGKISFSVTVTNKDRAKGIKPLITITTEAYAKMISLIKNCGVELAWHGIVERLDTYNYRITDILVYPQKVASATVESDDDKYPDWLMGLEDDQVNALRFQGHSHVNMGVSPSTVDKENWQKFLETLTDNDFYIFCIGNKRGEFYWTIYDLQTGWIYEPADIDIEIELNATKTAGAWADDMIEEFAKKQSFVQPKSYWGMSDPFYQQVYGRVEQMSFSPLRDKITGGKA